jgi:hypothetical protein
VIQGVGVTHLRYPVRKASHAKAPTTGAKTTGGQR